MKIVSQHIFPPIPDRSHDWMAYDDNTYDGPGSPAGWGATEQEARDDFMEVIGMNICYVCDQPHEITERIESYEVCLGCLRKAHKAADVFIAELRKRNQ